MSLQRISEELETIASELKEGAAVTMRADSIQNSVEQFLGEVIGQVGWDWDDPQWDKATVSFSLSSDEWNPMEPSEYGTMDVYLVFDLYRESITVKALDGKTIDGKKIPYLMEADLNRLKRAIRDMLMKVPSSLTRPDTPSLQDTAPAEYYTER